MHQWMGGTVVSVWLSDDIESRRRMWIDRVGGGDGEIAAHAQHIGGNPRPLVQCQRQVRARQRKIRSAQLAIAGAEHDIGPRQTDPGDDGWLQSHQADVIEAEESAIVPEPELQHSVAPGCRDLQDDIGPAEGREISLIKNHGAIPRHLEFVGRFSIRTVQPEGQQVVCPGSGWKRLGKKAKRSDRTQLRTVNARTHVT